MKKCLSMLLALGMALTLCVTAFADGRGPTFTSYDVVCKKETPYYYENWDDEDDVENGVMEKKGTFPAGTKLTVEYEYETDGVLYGDVKKGEGEDAEWVYIRLSDVELQNDVYLPQNDQRLSEPRTVRVIAKGGIPLYAGPNKQYDVVSTIPRGTKLTYEYSNDKDDYYRTWAYVSFFGKEGWINVYTNDTKNGVAQIPDKDDAPEIWALADDVQMYSGMSFGNIEDDIGEGWGEDYIAENREDPDRVVGTLKKGEKLTARYVHGSNFGEWYYVTSGLRSGWVFVSYNNDKVAASTSKRQENMYIAFRPFKLKLRETPHEKAAGVTVNVSKGDVLNPEYEIETQDGTFYFDTIDGQSGWFSYFDMSNNAAQKWHVYADGMNTEMTNDNDQPAPIYGDIMKKDKTLGKIPAGASFTPLYHGDYETKIDEENSEYTWFYYVDYKGTTGWVIAEDLYAPDVEEPHEDERDDSLDDEVWDGDGYWDGEESEEAGYGGLEEDFDDETLEEPETDAVQADTAYVPHSGLSPLQIVLICVGGAAVLALTAVVTLVLIRRKRKAKDASPAPAEEKTREYGSDE